MKKIECICKRCGNTFVVNGYYKKVYCDECFPLAMSELSVRNWNSPKYRKKIAKSLAITNKNKTEEEQIQLSNNISKGLKKHYEEVLPEPNGEYTLKPEQKVISCTCLLCGKKNIKHLGVHLIHTHHIRVSNYLQQFPDAEISNPSNNPKTVEKLQATKQRNGTSHAPRPKLSGVMKKKWQNPEYRNQVIETLNATNKTPETHQRRLDGLERSLPARRKKLKEYADTEEGKQRNSEAGQKGSAVRWARPGEHGRSSQFMKDNNPMDDPEKRDRHWKVTHTEEAHQQQIAACAKGGNTIKTILADPEKRDEYIARMQTPEARAKRKKSLQETDTRLKIEDPERWERWHGHRDHPKYKTGNFFSAKNNKIIYYRSSYEKVVYETLEQLSKVENYIVEPFPIPYEWEGSMHNYFPDVLVIYTDGSQQLIEIKPEIMVDEPINVAKFEAARDYCKSNDMSFDVWTENEIRAISV